MKPIHPVSPFAAGMDAYCDGLNLREAREAGGALMEATCDLDVELRAYGVAAAEEGWLYASQQHIQRLTHDARTWAELSDAFQVSATMPCVAIGAFLFVAAVLLFTLSAGW